MTDEKKESETKVNEKEGKKYDGGPIPKVSPSKKDSDK